MCDDVEDDSDGRGEDEDEDEDEDENEDVSLYHTLETKNGRARAESLAWDTTTRRNRRFSMGLILRRFLDMLLPVVTLRDAYGRGNQPPMSDYYCGFVAQEEHPT